MVILTAAIAVLAFHPIHTTMTELTIDESRHSLQATIRVFADDVANAARGGDTDSYVRNALVVTSRDGKRFDFQPCGVRRSGAVAFICMKAAFSGAPRDLRVANSLLCDLFTDQVNVVQVSVGPDRRSMLFTRGDRAKPIA